jgi:hypothetical protein
MRYVIAILLFGSSGFGQDAVVTFYSPGSLGKAVLKASATLGYPSKVPFAGYVFDGERRLCFLQPGRFMTLRLKAGPHTFATAAMTWTTSRSSDKVFLPLTLESGEQYFVQMTQNNKGFYIVQVPFQHIAQVDCAKARQEASGTEPIKAKRVEKEVRDSLENVSYFPKCK